MEIQVKAAKTLLREGVALNAKPPLWLFWLRPKLYQPSGAQLVKICQYYASTGLDKKDLFNINSSEALVLLSLNLETFARMLAICMFKNYRLAMFFHKPLARWILRNKSAEDILGMWEIVAHFSGLSDFLSTTRLLKQLNMLGQVEKRS
jgi:hypothetical protein